MRPIDTAGERKPHAVCIPMPSQGHINGMLRLAKLLYSKGFHITFIHSESNYDRIFDSVGHGAFCDLDVFRFRRYRATYELTTPMHSEFCTPVHSLLSRLNAPLPTCVVLDLFMRFAIGLSTKIRVPNIILCPMSACSFMAFFHYKELLFHGEEKLFYALGVHSHVVL